MHNNSYIEETMSARLLSNLKDMFLKTFYNMGQGRE